jgi:hypothetical protein
LALVVEATHTTNARSNGITALHKSAIEIFLKGCTSPTWSWDASD